MQTNVDLLHYLAEFDLTLFDVGPRQLAMFLAARNAGRYVDERELALGRYRREEGEADLKEQETDRVLELTAYSLDDLPSHLPADEMDVSAIQSVEELPRIFPVQWLLEETNPDLFYAKLAQRGLLVPEWQRPTQRPLESLHESPEREMVPEPVRAETAKLHAYVLLDTSSTMEDRDRRGLVARGLALAFLLKGHEQDARLMLRPFTAEVGELSSGVTREDFRAIVRRVIELPNAGQTRIQMAVEQAVEDIREAGPSRGAHIMLITDGLSHLARNPLGDEKLHTFILGDLLETAETNQTISILKEWSQTLQRIWQNRFAELLTPTERDCRAAVQFLQDLETALGDGQRADSAQPDADRLRRALENVRYLVQELQRSQGKAASLSPEVRALDEQLRAVEQGLAVVGCVKRTTQNPQDCQAPSGAFHAPYAVTLESPRLWQRLRAWMVRLWNWTRRICRGLFAAIPGARCRRRRSRGGVGSP